MRLVSLDGNRQRLDGGAMFGNCPRAVWQRWAPPDDRNRIPLACRALLVQEPSREATRGRNILDPQAAAARIDCDRSGRYLAVEARTALT